MLVCWDTWCNCTVQLNRESEVRAYLRRGVTTGYCEFNHILQSTGMTNLMIGVCGVNSLSHKYLILQYCFHFVVSHNKKQHMLRCSYLFDYNSYCFLSSWGHFSNAWQCLTTHEPFYRCGLCIK